jgi:hypothetical protein
MGRPTLPKLLAISHDTDPRTIYGVSLGVGAAHSGEQPAAQLGQLAIVHPTAEA